MSSQEYFFWVSSGFRLSCFQLFLWFAGYSQIFWHRSIHQQHLELAFFSVIYHHFFSFLFLRKFLSFFSTFHCLSDLKQQSFIVITLIFILGFYQLIFLRIFYFTLSSSHYFRIFIFLIHLLTASSTWLYLTQFIHIIDLGNLCFFINRDLSHQPSL